ncbi:protein kinase C-binding protein 1-like isoform X2 [Amphibalanus amphitrite]|uniref:protein kinase C-binding protein 1-like isoform X2 n=1 Tax=Amphibalanus amphitrite TaxID=1232801 RepID=UPI001C9123A6|nr:protein kinase C-binding protein 1-like isoform X2 [Amphibalanus amphitrite]XP_043205133.1 protein kinase C-binding protein 1-like isoform X2 [Amphibalanus amphitrite]
MSDEEGETPLVIDQSSNDGPEQLGGSGEKMDAKPAEENMDSKPAEEKMDANPSEERMDSNPAQEGMDSNPVEEGMDSNPTEEGMDSNSSEGRMDSSPSDERMDSNPAEEKMDSNLAEERMDSNPTEKGMDSSPLAERMDSNPSEEGDAPLNPTDTVAVDTGSVEAESEMKDAVVGEDKSDGMDVTPGSSAPETESKQHEVQPEQTAPENIPKSSENAEPSNIAKDPKNDTECDGPEEKSVPMDAADNPVAPLEEKEVCAVKDSSSADHTTTAASAPQEDSPIEDSTTGESNVAEAASLDKPSDSSCKVISDTSDTPSSNSQPTTNSGDATTGSVADSTGDADGAGTATTTTPAADPVALSTVTTGTPTVSPVNTPSVTPADTPSGAPASTPSTAPTETPGAGGTPRSRVTRSRNPDFAAKQKSFMRKFHRSVSGGGGGGASPAPDGTPGAPRSEKRAASEDSVPPAKRRKLSEASDEPRPSDTAANTGTPNDNFCWVCHREGQVVCCETCPRVFHLKCAQLSTDPPGDWVCVECQRVVLAESSERRLPPERLQQLIMFALGRLKGLPGAEPFLQPVDERKFPTYREFVAWPMDLSTMEKNAERGQYGSTAALIADCKWILHNCILFNGTGNKLTTLAKSLVRMCKWEMEEIETCPDCYGNAYLSDNWFTLACPHPHLLIWARLKGFPFWPAKAVKTRDGNVDCRFFGRHDRAWVPAKECFLFSREPPVTPKNRTKSLDACVEELEEHVKNLEKRFGAYNFAKPKTQYNPKRVQAQLLMTIPGYGGRDAETKPASERSGVKRSNSDIQLEILDRLRQDKKARQAGGEPEPPAPEQSAEGGADDSAEAGTGDSAEAGASEQSAETATAGEDDSPKAGEGDSPAAEVTQPVQPPTDSADKDTGTAAGPAKTAAPAASAAETTEPANRSAETPVAAATPEPSVPSADPAESSAPAADESEGEQRVKRARTESRDSDLAETKDAAEETAETADSVDTVEETASAEPAATEEPVKAAIAKTKTETTKTKARTEGAKAEHSKKAKVAGTAKADPPKAATAAEPVVAVKTEPVQSPAPVVRLSSNEEEKEQRPPPRRRTARKSLSAAATAAASASSSSGAPSASPATAKAAAPSKSGSSSSAKSASKSDGSGLSASRFLSRLSTGAANKAWQPTGASTTVTVAKSPRTPATAARSTAAAVKTVAAGGSATIHVSKAIKAGAATSNGVAQQVLTAPLRPKLITSTPRPPVTSTPTVQQSIIVNRAGARLMIPRASLYLPTGSAAGGGALTSTAPLTSMMVIPGGLATATNGTALVTYPAVSSAAKAPIAHSETGPVTAAVDRLAQELTAKMRDGVERILAETATSGSTAASVARLKMEMERMEWRHRADLAEQKRTLETQISELRTALTKEQKKSAAKLSSALAAEAETWERLLEKRIAETKKKQWCANCGKEAIFYCCWNTSYCDFPCQEAQWPKHMLTCANQQANNAAAADSGGDEDGRGLSA